MYTFLIFTYTPTAFLAISICYCIPSNDEGGDTTVMWANPNIECLGPEHTPLLILSVLVLVFDSIGFPVWTYFKLRGVFYGEESSKHSTKISSVNYKKFFGDDYLPEYYWILHCQMALSFTLCTTRVYLSTFSDETQISKLVLNTVATIGFMSTLCWFRPHVRHMRWKFPVQILLLFLIILTSILEFINFLHLNHGTVSSNVVEAFSNLVLVIACCVFIVLGVSFYFVIYSEKDPEYFAKHFLLQKTATLRDARAEAESRKISRMSRSQSRAHSRAQSKIMAPSEYKAEISFSGRNSVRSPSIVHRISQAGTSTSNLGRFHQRKTLSSSVSSSAVVATTGTFERRTTASSSSAFTLKSNNV
mmetsp:Transcript_7505/g.10545  ORF Transcript_7505/g.10545 Transcript_7505/m.10545 type:complete len:361 (-) Transcript_7505:166-1248(-)